ncbi:MAG: PhoH family protein, partial [Steroidobacteraceae bacterium]
MSVPDAPREFALTPADNVRLANLCGPLDENLRLLENRLDVQIRRRGDNFQVLGARSDSAEQTLRELFALAERDEVTPERVHLALREHESGRTPSEEHEESSIRLPRGGLRARGHHQRQYLSHIRSHDLTFGIGPAGTGKTYLAVACAVESLHAETIRRVVLVRPAVEAGERLGFLPGDLTQKIDPYLRPMYDALYEMLGFDRVSRFIERNVIEVAPLAFMRGRSLNDSFIILDEAQNTTVEQMKMFLTRIGFGSK